MSAETLTLLTKHYKVFARSEPSLAFNRYSYLLSTYYYAVGHHSLPTTSGFCTTSFMPTAMAMDSSNVEPVDARAAAER